MRDAVVLQKVCRRWGRPVSKFEYAAAASISVNTADMRLRRLVEHEGAVVLKGKGRAMYGPATLRVTVAFERLSDERRDAILAKDAADRAKGRPLLPAPTERKGISAPWSRKKKRA